MKYKNSLITESHKGGYKNTVFETARGPTSTGSAHRCGAFKRGCRTFDPVISGLLELPRINISAGY